MKMPQSRSNRKAMGRAALALTLILTAGIGAGGRIPVASAARPAAASGVRQAVQAVQTAMQRPKFVEPGSPVAMSKLKGKTIWIITSTLAVPFVATIAHGVQAAAQVAGLSTMLFDGKGNVSEWNRGMTEAVNQGASGIVTVGASPVLMKGPTAAAKKAHIPVVDTLTADQADPLVPGTFAHVSISFYHSGQIQADYTIAESNGRAQALVFGDNEFPGEVTRVQGMRQQFETLCPACAVTVQDTQVGNLGTALGQLTQTLLRRSPDITWVLPTYDAQAVYVVPALKQANLSSTVKVVSSDAVSSNLDWVRQGTAQVADVGEPDVWCGWAAVDEIARAMLGMPAVNERIPLRLFTRANLAGVADDENKLFGGDFVTQYKKLWGMSQ